MLFAIRYDREFDRHVVSRNHIPFYVTRQYPYVVTDHVVTSHDGMDSVENDGMDHVTNDVNQQHTISIALFSKAMAVGTLDTTGGGGFHHFRKIPMPDVALIVGVVKCAL
jgi:hypothetical protein